LPPAIKKAARVYQGSKATAPSVPTSFTPAIAAGVTDKLTGDW
jgi:hypothetical protein